MLTVGFQRYHYPLLPFMIAFAAAYIAQRMNKETENAKISPEKS
jgi:hypothetical protein